MRTSKSQLAQILRIFVFILNYKPWNENHHVNWLKFINYKPILLFSFMCIYDILFNFNEVLLFCCVVSFYIFCARGIRRATQFYFFHSIFHWEIFFVLGFLNRISSLSYEYRSHSVSPIHHRTRERPSVLPLQWNSLHTLGYCYFSFKISSFLLALSLSLLFKVYWFIVC